MQEKIERNKSNTNQDSTSKVGYRGEVNLKIASKDKVLANYKTHNAGTINLFRSIASYLISGKESNSGIPSYLTYNTYKESVDSSNASSTYLVYDATGSRVSPTRIKLQKPVASPASSDDNGPYDIYKITYTGQITNNTNSQLNIYQLALYADEDGTDTLLAFLNIRDAVDITNYNSSDTEEYITLKKNLSLIVEWTISIQNA